MKTSPKMGAYIRSKEKLELRAYRPHADDVLTIGYGHTGPDVHEGDVIGVEQAVELFRADLADAEREVDRLLRVPVTQGMYDCMVSMEFNSGGLEIVVSGKPTLSRFMQRVNEGRFADAVEELVCWNWSGGREYRGLLSRRLEEGLFFCSEPWP